MERPLFQLGARLSACADFVRKGNKLADIGTDHALLPIWLVRSGIVNTAIAADLREGPLRSAAENAEKHQVSEQITTKLSDGLQNIQENEADDIVIAGMGGTLILKIINEAPWLKNLHKQLILQPMKDVHDLRKGLAEEGFGIKKEKAVLDTRPYTIMSVYYTGQKKTLSLFEMYMGEIDPETTEARAYAEKVCRMLEKEMKGFAGNSDKEEIQKRVNLKLEIEEKYGVKK